jgi:glycosyltransferase involved in cell wall biosynthesis
MKKVNLMVSTNRHGQGGIATVVTGYYNEGLIDDFSFISINSHSSKYKSRLVAIILFIYSLLKIIYYGIFYKLGLAHVHMASRGSYSRKSIIIRLVRSLGAKTILHLHGAEFEDFYKNECSSKKQQHIRNTFNLADKVIVLSSQWLKWVNTIVKDKSKSCIVYNAVEEVTLPHQKEVSQSILFLGRLGQRKGTEDLINAFAKIANNFPMAELHLGGDGDIDFYRDKVTRLGIIKQVTFLGWISGEIKNKYLAKAAIYCLPSYNEGFPMGVLEAMSANVAVVASTAGGIPDAITDQQEGLLIEAGDVDALASALTTLLENDVLRKEYINAAKTKYQKNFSPNIIIPRLKRIYKELLEQK